MTTIYHDLPAPQTPAQEIAHGRVVELAQEITAWCIDRRRNDHRNTFDPRMAPQYDALREAIHHFTHLINSGK